MSRSRQARRRFLNLQVETLEPRLPLAFSVLNADIFSQGLKLVADFNQPIDTGSVQAADLIVDGAQAATSVNVVDADTVEFFLPALAAGSHSATIAAGAIVDGSNVGLDAFSKPFNVASALQFIVKHNPRLQPGNAPLAGYAGGDLDRVDILWQTKPGGTGTQDTFSVEYRPVGGTTWQSAGLNSAIDTGVESRVVRSASITGLNWNAAYEYRVRHWSGDLIVNQYTSQFRTRLNAGDSTPFSFAAYGDSASGSATGFRQVQSRINQVNPAFAVLLGDNVYSVGSHLESDARFDPIVNPEAASWMAGHIDYLGLGNHDVGTSSGLPSEQNFSVPVPVAGVTAPATPPTTTERPEHNFSWDYGNVHFVTFDTNSYTDSARLDGLLNWVVADLAASTARWKVVYGHHPLAGVPDKPENPGGNYYQQVVNRLKAAGVDLFMTGHSHTYSWTYPLTGQINGTATYANHGVNDYFHAGEGLPQLVSGVGGVEIRTGDYGQFPFVAAGFSSTTPTVARFGFTKVDVTPDELTVSYVAADNGAVIDSFRIAKESNVQVASFQQGVSSYAGTVDTYLHQNTPTTSFATSTSLKVDNDDPAGLGFDAQTLLRFENLFGSNAGQIPANAILRSATLQLQVTNGSINNMNLHRMLTAWDATDTWNSRVNGVQTDGVEAVISPDTSSGTSQLGALSFNVLASLQAWQTDPASNRGWALMPTGTDGIDFNSSEGTTKPKLIVTYVVPSGPNDPPVARDDSATVIGGSPSTISVLANDSDPNGNSLSIQAVTQPANGTTTINAGTAITYTPTAGFYGSDRFSYTISDGQGGSATATVDVTVVKSVSFQQAIDTFLQENSPAVNNSLAVSLNVDSDDPAGSNKDVQTLVRFENLFGPDVSQIPVGATLQSATLQLQVTNPGNSMNLHRMVPNWAATDTWDTLVGGVQNNGVEAVAAADVSTGAVATGLLSIDVLASLQAWQSDPNANRGWVLLPTGSDGVDFDSSEGATKPKLLVKFLPPSNTPPTISDIANQTINEDSTTGPLAFIVGDAETSAAGLVVSASSSNTTLVPNANLVLGGSGANRTLTATPAANKFGSATITVTVSDGSLSSSDTFVLTVSAVNDAPVAVNDSTNTIATNPVTISVLSNDSDVENDPLTVSIVSPPASGTATVNADKTVTYVAAAGFVGTATFTYKVNDGFADSNVATVTVTVAPATKFFVADATADKSFQYQSNGVYVSQLSLNASNINARGIAANSAGTQVWVLDSNKTVYVYDTNMTLLGSWIANGLSTPTGIAVAGTNVWIVDSQLDRAYLFANATTVTAGSVTATRSFALGSGNTNPQDIATDGTTVWVVHSGTTDKIYVYRASDGVSLGNWTIDSRNASPTGLTLDPTGQSQSLWTVDNGTDRVYEYANGRARRNKSQTAAVVFALTSGNGDPQGIADPPPAPQAARMNVVAIDYLLAQSGSSSSSGSNRSSSVTNSLPSSGSLQPAVTISDRTTILSRDPSILADALEANMSSIEELARLRVSGRLPKSK